MFDSIYDDITKTTENLERTMSYIYEHSKNNPTDTFSMEVLQGLGNTLKDILNIQREFTINYGTPDLKDTLVSRLNDKEMFLTTQLEQINNNRARF